MKGPASRRSMNAHVLSISLVFSPPHHHAALFVAAAAEKMPLYYAWLNDPPSEPENEHIETDGSVDIVFSDHTLRNVLPA